MFASTAESQVIAVDKATGGSRVVADLAGEVPWRIAIDATHVYWTSAPTGGVWSAPNPARRPRCVDCFLINDYCERMKHAGQPLNTVRG